MSRFVTDTHALHWHLVGNTKLSHQAQHILSSADKGIYQVVVPSIVLIEFVYLAEKGRIDTRRVDDLFTALSIPNGSYVIAPLDSSVATALRRIPRESIPEMPDRIITATALHLGLPLITRDFNIQSSGIVPTIW